VLPNSPLIMGKGVDPHKEGAEIALDSEISNGGEEYCKTAASLGESP